ncbi:MAG: hypothetical protein RL607_1066 [Bacteroidota bacterium]|jgi:hypothetical protein
MKRLSVYQRIALVTFSGGTLLFYGALITKEELFIPICILYTLICGLVHGICLLLLFFSFLRHPMQRKSIVREGLILWVNFPIAILYLFIYLYSQNILL